MDSDWCLDRFFELARLAHKHFQYLVDLHVMHFLGPLFLLKGLHVFGEFCIGLGHGEWSQYRCSS